MNESANSNLSHDRLLAILNGSGEYASNRLDGRHILIVVLSIAAFVTNGLALGAICVIRRRLSANQTMMLSLCCADLLSAIGILGTTLTQQFYGRFTVPDSQQHAATCVYKVAQATILTGHNATLFNLLCLAVDHYCAIAKPLTYSLYMSKRRVHIMLSMFWAISVVFGFSDFLIPAPLYGHCLMDLDSLKGKYCERVYCSAYEPEHLMFCVVLVCLVVMTVMYGGIMCILVRYQRQGYTTAPQRKARRHIRGLVTSFIILGIFAVFWLPNCIMDAYATLKMKRTAENAAKYSTGTYMRNYAADNDTRNITTYGDDGNFTKYDYVGFFDPDRNDIHISDELRVGQIHQQFILYLLALVILNAVFDPIVYALRMREIQEGLKTFLRFKRPTFSNKMNGFGEALRSRSSNNSFPMKYVQRQYSTNSTNTTVCSGTSLSERANFSRKGTMTSQVSELTEDTPLSGNISMAQFDLS